MNTAMAERQKPIRRFGLEFHFAHEKAELHSKAIRLSRVIGKHRSSMCLEKYEKSAFFS